MDTLLCTHCNHYFARNGFKQHTSACARKVLLGATSATQKRVRSDAAESGRAAAHAASALPEASGAIASGGRSGGTDGSPGAGDESPSSSDSSGDDGGGGGGGGGGGSVARAAAPSLAAAAAAAGLACLQLAGGGRRSRARLPFHDFVTVHYTNLRVAALKVEEDLTESQVAGVVKLMKDPLIVPADLSTAKKVGRRLAAAQESGCPPESLEGAVRIVLPRPDGVPGKVPLEVECFSFGLQAQFTSQRRPRPVGPPGALR